MDPTQAKMFVRSINPSAARILITFILARSALDVKELREWTGMKRETIYEGLNTLHLFGMVEKQIVAHGRVVWLPAGDLLPGFQMSAKRTSELQVSGIGTPALVGGESINLTLNTDSLNTTESQMSGIGTSGFPSVLEILKHTDLLFDGDLVSSKGLDDRDPLAALAWCAYAYSRKSKLSGAGGVVRNRLVDNEAPPEWARQQWQETLPSDFLEVLGLIEYTCEVCQAKFKTLIELTAHDAMHPKPHVCDFCQQTFQEQIDLDAHIAEEHTLKVIHADESVTVPINGSLTAEQAWQSVLGQLQMEMPRASFETWVRDTKAVRYGRNALTIACPTAYTCEWLESRLTSTVNRLLVGILNSTSIAVEFIVGNPESEA